MIEPKPFSKVVEELEKRIGHKPTEYTLGDPVADQFLRVRHGQLIVVLGHGGTGKTTWLLWYLHQLSTIHGLKSSIYSGENDNTDILKNILEIHEDKSIWEMDGGAEYLSAVSYLSEYFHLVNDAGMYTAEELLEEFEGTDSDFCVIDPHNSVKIPRGMNWYQYSVELGMELRSFCKRTGKTVFLVSHPNTEAQRRVHKSGDMLGHKMPPNAPDIEGGGTWFNKCDQFWNVHRYTSHQQKWKELTVEVAKIKYQDTGVKPTPKDFPLVFHKTKTGFFIGS